MSENKSALFRVLAAVTPITQISRRLVELASVEFDDMRDTIESLTAERDRLASEVAELRAQVPEGDA